MPIVKEINHPTGSRIFVWRIEESVETLVEMIDNQTHINSCEYDKFGSESRRKQWLACRLALRHALQTDNFAIRYTPDGKPYIDASNIGISLSHTECYAAVALVENGDIGIDIEIISQRPERVKHRFLSPQELSSAKHDMPTLTTYWSAKESMFKYLGTNNITLERDIRIEPFDYQELPFSIHGKIAIQEYVKSISLMVETIDNHILTYTTN